MLKVVIISFLLVKCANLSDVTYYEILGVEKQASAQEIRQAYKKLAVKYHPDKNPDVKIQQQFLKITEAYETLKDPDKRHNYDVYGSYQSYTRKYDHRSQAEYNSLYYNGLYHDDPFVDTLSGGGFYNYLQDGFHFINFYSPFCPPCQSLCDHWKKLAEVYKGIIKVGAVNCKYYNSFCYNSMRIGSYPSLLFYPNGKNGNYLYYRGDRTFDALERFVLGYLEKHIQVPVVTQIRGSERPIAYVLGSNRIDSNALTRIAYHLRGLVTVVMVEDDTLRAKLTKNEYTTVVFKYKAKTKEIESTEEKDVLKDIVANLPTIEKIGPEQLKKIRDELRNNYGSPWVLYLSSPGDDRLLLHQMMVAHTDMHFGEVDCEKWSELCLSLQASGPTWGVLKPGGAYQQVPVAGLRGYLPDAARATNLHSLSGSDLARILDGNVGVWVLLVVPLDLPWEHHLEGFTHASTRYRQSHEINFGIMSCTTDNERQCRELVGPEVGVVALVAGKRHHYSGRIELHALPEWIELIRDSADLELNERQVLEIMDASSREHSWLVAFLPAHCGRVCQQLLHEWRLVARKLRPLEFVRVGALQCAPGDRGFCSNIRVPTARLYPYASGKFYTVNLQELNQAAYILEWSLGLLDESVSRLNWYSFSSLITAEELRGPGAKAPWLVYFHSPRCYRCYEMYADFAIAGIKLNNAVNLGKVNCLTERSLCQQEHVTSYPSLRLYLGRNRNTFSSVITIPVSSYTNILNDIKPQLERYHENILAGVENLGVGSFHIHDEF